MNDYAAIIAIYTCGTLASIVVQVLIGLHTIRQCREIAKEALTPQTTTFHGDIYEATDLATQMKRAAMGTRL